MGKKVAYPLEGIIYPPRVSDRFPYVSEEYLGMPSNFLDPQGCIQSLSPLSAHYFY